MGIEPTTDIVCPPLDLKSRRTTRTCPLPPKKLIDFPFKVNLFQMFSILVEIGRIVTLLFSNYFALPRASFNSLDRAMLQISPSDRFPESIAYKSEIFRFAVGPEMSLFDLGLV